MIANELYEIIYCIFLFYKHLKMHIFSFKYMFFGV